MEAQWIWIRLQPKPYGKIGMGRANLMTQRTSPQGVPWDGKVG